MYTPVIGLEIHIQLKTKSKMFCSCNNSGEDLPANTTICPICTGQPGTLPVPNLEALELGVKASLGINCVINNISKFDRKHYFYPDLPKGYQISQFDLPVGENGYLEIETTDQDGISITKKIGIIRLHLEEDAAKLVHGADGSSYVDYNRAGTPLAEIVTAPDIATPAEAKIFLQNLRTIARYLGASNADMEKGHLRCDANISLRPSGDTTFYPKTEIKNLNSFRAVERALEYEIIRQTKLWDEGTPPNISTTRGWNDTKQVTEEQRTKEEAHDYRFVPEPDIPPLDLQEIAKKMAAKLPEMPAKKKLRFMAEFGLSFSDTNIIIADQEWANFTEHVFSEAWAWLSTLPELEAEGTEEQIMAKNKAKLGKLIGGWITSKLMGIMAENKIDIRIIKITPENFAEFISLIYTNKINSTNAQILLQKMLETGEDPSQIMEEKKLGQVTDPDFLDKAIENVIRLNPEQVAQYLAGKTAIIQFLVGKAMKETNGQADPNAVKTMLEKKIIG